MRRISSPALCITFFALAGTAANPAGPPPNRRLVCDFDTVEVPWRSRSGGHTVTETERDGTVTRAIRLRADLSQAPGYDWIRTVADPGHDVRPFAFLTFGVAHDGPGYEIVPALIQRSNRPEASRHGEIVAAADRHRILLKNPGWTRYSIPLSGFGNLERIAAQVHMINFFLVRAESPHPGPTELWFDDIAFTSEPEGSLVPLQEEPIRFPPADIAVADDREFFAALDLERPELAAGRTAVATDDWPAARAAWARHLESRETPAWTWSPRDRDRIRHALEEHSNGLAWAIPHAERVLAREFDFLGVRKHLEKDPEWLHGPIEWTHVLSRFHYWRSLGYAYWETGDPRYAEDFVHLLRHWITANPVPRILTNARGQDGNVWRTLETGIRGDCWFEIMNLFMHAPEFRADEKTLMTRSLVEHARHLHRYHVAFRPGNWQVVECSGLAVIGIMLPEFREAAEWRERAFEYLRRHMQEDVHPDGAHSELTPLYHGVVVERFMKIALLAERNGYEIPGLLDRHERMFEFLLALAKPDGRFPPLGNAGSGGSVRANLGLGALLYDRPDMRSQAVETAPAAWVWLFGPDVFARYAELPAAVPAFTSILLPDAQYIMMRTGWGRDDRYLLFDCAPWGGAHSHHDRLQVIVHSGRDLLLDPGQYSYDQPLSRTYFGTSAAHNVLLIDEQEQIAANPRVVTWATAADFDLTAGLELRFADGQVDRLAVAPDVGSLRAGPLAGTARVLCVREGPRTATFVAE